MSNLNQPLRGCEPLLQFNKFRQEFKDRFIENPHVQENYDQIYSNLKIIKEMLNNLIIQFESQRKEFQEISNNIQQVQYELKQYGIPFNQYQPLAHDDQLAKMKNQVTGLFYQNNIAFNQQIINKITEILIQNLNDVFKNYKSSNNYNQILQQQIDDFKKSIMQQNDDFNHILGQVEYLNYNFVDKIDKFDYQNQDIQLIQQQQELEKYIDQFEQGQQRSLIQLQPSYLLE